MNKRRQFRNSFSAALLVTACFLAFSWGSGCANIIPPTGGPRDSIPPVLLSVVPKDSTKHFTGKKIVFNFNEYINLANPDENILFSPTPKIRIDAKFKLRTMTITIPDTLEPNTTYSIDFGNALVDNNEGNILHNFTYVFTTGDSIDAGTLDGSVVIAETGKVDSTLIAMLYRSADDSAVTKERPRYIAKLNNNGYFHFHHLAKGTYYLYALKDEGGAHRYSSPKQLFAFAAKPVQVQDSAAPQELYAYLERDTFQLRPKTTRSTEKPKAAAEKKIRYQVNTENGAQSLLDSFKMSFALPLKSFDSTKFNFSDANYQRLPTGTIVIDSLTKLLSFAQHWVPDAQYHLVLEPGVTVDSAGNGVLKTDTVTFRAKKEEDYGSLKLRFRNLDLTKTMVLQFVQSDAVKYSFPLKTGQFSQRLFTPGDYDLRILFDDNNNGRYDPGEFFGRHIQPERVRPILKKITVKGNWDNEVEISL